MRVGAGAKLKYKWLVTSKNLFKFQAPRYLETAYLSETNHKFSRNLSIEKKSFNIRNHWEGVAFSTHLTGRHAAGKTHSMKSNNTITKPKSRYRVMAPSVALPLVPEHPRWKKYTGVSKRWVVNVIFVLWLLSLHKTRVAMIVTDYIPGCRLTSIHYSTYCWCPILCLETL